MRSPGQARGATCELEFCFCRADCGDGLIETFRVAFELELDYRHSVRDGELSNDAAESAWTWTTGKSAPSG